MSTPIRLLIVEDSEDDALLMVRELQRGGYAPTFERVETPVAMKASLNKQKWDVILADYSMPHFNGLEALKLLKESELDLPFIIVSGSIGEEIAVAAMKAGAHDYIMKNNLARLVPAIERELRDALTRRERKEAEKAFKESERFSWAVLETAPSLIVLTDPEGRILLFNRACEVLTGYKREEVIGKTISELFLPPEWIPIVQKRFADPYAPEVRAPHENPWRTKSGEERLIEWRCTVLSSPVDGSPHILGTGIDISERKQAEEALRKNEERFRLAAESSTDLIYEWDTEEQVDWFGKIDELLGYTQDEFPRTFEAWADSLHPDDRDRVKAAVKNHLEKNEPYDIEYRIRKKDGTYNYWWVRGTAVRDEKGSPYQWVGAVTDITDRKRAEQALFDSEQRYRNLVDNAPDVIFTLAPDGKIISLNPAFERITGWPRSEWLDKQFATLLHSDDLSRSLELFQRTLKGEKIAPFQLAVLNKSGHHLVAEITVTPQTQNESVVGVLGIARDVTERKQMEDNLRKRNEFIQAILDNMPIGVAVNTIDDGITRYMNRCFEEIYGWPEEKLTDVDTFFERVFRDPIYRREIEEKILSDMATGDPSRMKWDAITVTGMDGQQRVVGAQNIPLMSQNLMISTVWDITQQKRAEEALRRSEEEARQLAQGNAIMAEVARIISSTLDIDEVYERFAEEAKKIISFDRIVINMIDTEKGTVRNAYIAGEGVEDRNVEEIYPLKGSGNAEMVRTKSTLLIQTEDFKEYKDRFPMLLSTFQAGFRSFMNVPLFSKGKIIGGLLLRSRKPYAYTEKDVKLAERIGSQIAGAIANAQLFAERLRTEEEKAALQEQLRQSQKMEAIGRLAGGVAHDFNNLLTIIKGNSELSLMDVKKDDPLRENLEGVLRASGRASDLIRQLLAFSRRQVMEMEVLDLNTLLKDLDKMLRRIIGEDIELVTVLTKDLERIKADAGQIEQVILNLAVNSRDAMPSGGRLTIETANAELDAEYARRHVAVIPGRYVMLSVSDTGVGMIPEVRDKVFEPFFTTKESSKGTGLGLSTVYGIVKQSGGNIWVYSEPGKGTTFKIYLPRVDEPLGEVVREKAAEGGLPRGSETILIVEDDEDVREVAVRIFKMQGYRVLETSNGSNALHVSEQEAGPIHLMVTDVVMPGMNGPELAKRLNPLRPEMKVLYISGYTDNAIVHHGVLGKGVNYIQKPFPVEGLARKVREVLDQ